MHIGKLYTLEIRAKHLGILYVVRTNSIFHKLCIYSDHVGVSSRDFFYKCLIVRYLCLLLTGLKCVSYVFLFEIYFVRGSQIFLTHAIYLFASLDKEFVQIFVFSYNCLIFPLRVPINFTFLIKTVHLLTFNVRILNLGNECFHLAGPVNYRLA